jgi:glycerol-3-phosphate dehydrogenase subunit C
MQRNTPESLVRAVLEACADCDTCRYLMDDTSCQVFPELYRLYDKEAEKQGEITPQELRTLVDLCNFCALCPCPDIRADLMKAKHAFIERDGLQPAIRLLEDVGRLARLGGAYPRLTNSLLRFGPTGGCLKRLAGIHPERKVPAFPQADFAKWAGSEGLPIKPGEKQRKVAFFSGCTAQYFFPAVPQAAVDVLRRNDIDVYYPEQKCCGMPSLLEGGRSLTLEFAAFNVDSLAEAVEEGFDIVCSCPTCGYMLKSVWSEGACYAADSSPRTGVFSGLFKDEGYFASIEAQKRLRVARHTYDLGEYLRDLQRAEKLNTNFGPVSAQMAYFPPCHLREQKIGEPYADLLKMVPGVDLEQIAGAFYCCGIAGIMGFKRDFHEVSVAMGSRLMDKIKSINPERLLCDCLSCRLQFNQLLPYQVFHPVEILSESYASYGACGCQSSPPAWSTLSSLRSSGEAKRR